MAITIKIKICYMMLLISDMTYLNISFRPTLPSDTKSDTKKPSVHRTLIRGKYDIYLFL